MALPRPRAMAVRAGASALGRARRLAERPEVRRWLDDEGDRRLRLAYDLDERSVVFDVGGYQGQFASDVYGRFRCTVHVFEPVPAFAAAIAERFAANPDIRVHGYGLSGVDARVPITLEGDRSRLGAGSTVVDVRRTAGVLDELGIEQVDLVKLNIEGAEFDLLEHLLADGLQHRVRHLQVQFHDHVPDARARAAAIRSRLAASHDLRWQYDFVWESWTRR